MYLDPVAALLVIAKAVRQPAEAPSPSQAMSQSDPLEICWQAAPGKVKPVLHSRLSTRVQPAAAPSSEVDCQVDSPVCAR